MAGFEGFVPERWVTIREHVANLRHLCDVFFHRLAKACHVGLAGLFVGAAISATAEVC